MKFMDAKKEEGKNPEEEESCCCEGDCHCGCRRGCPWWAAVIVILVFLVGGIIGYLMGNCKRSCHMMMGAPCPMSSMQQAPSAPK